MEDLNRNISKFCEIENCSDDEKTIPNDNYCERSFKENYSRNTEGRFVIKLPIIPEVLDKLGDSKNIALKRLYSLERKFDRSPKLKADYVDFMKEYLMLGHMRVARQLSEGKKRVFLPHQAVAKEKTVTTKTRVVFDASSKDSNGISLNEALHKGPTMLPDIFVTLLRFRCFKYIICADVKKMYRQILIHDHIYLQTILWRKDKNCPIEVFELTTLTYGTKPASYLASRCLLQLADDGQDKFPRAAEIIRRLLYGRFNNRFECDIRIG